MPHVTWSFALFDIFVEKFSYKTKKIVRSSYRVIWDDAFFYVSFISVMKMFWKSLNPKPFGVRGVIMPMN
jgi:hypothetical protein